MTAKRAGKPRHRVPPELRAAATDVVAIAMQRGRELNDALRQNLILKRAGLAALQLLIEMEREGALRLPFPKHQATMLQLRKALGVR